MKHSREILKRLISAEKKFGATCQVKTNLRNFDGLYYGACGQGLTQEQFDLWVSQQDPRTELITLELPPVPGLMDDAESEIAECQEAAR